MKAIVEIIVELEQMAVPNDVESNKRNSDTDTEVEHADNEEGVKLIAREDHDQTVRDHGNDERHKLT